LLFHLETSVICFAEIISILLKMTNRLHACIVLQNDKKAKKAKKQKLGNKT
jgi:hypothetical protein